MPFRSTRASARCGTALAAVPGMYTSDPLSATLNWEVPVATAARTPSTIGTGPLATVSRFTSKGTASSVPESA